MERSESDNFIEIKFAPAAAEEAQSLRAQLAEKEPGVEARLVENPAGQSLEARWMRGLRTYVLYLPTDGDFEKLFKRVEGLKNL